ncbi:MAG TPA: hypothetical protein VF761_17245 [Gemmatimonadaceae bacterium]
MKKTVATLVMLIAGAFAALVLADEPAPAPSRPVIPIAKAKKGCTFRVGGLRNSVYYEAAYIVAKRLMPIGEPDEFWIVFPNREQDRDESGHLRTNNVSADRVLFMSPKDGPVIVLRDGLKCKCPPALWGAASGVSAEH